MAFSSSNFLSKQKTSVLNGKIFLVLCDLHFTQRISHIGNLSNYLPDNSSLIARFSLIVFFVHVVPSMLPFHKLNAED